MAKGFHASPKKKQTKSKLIVRLLLPMLLLVLLQLVTFFAILIAGGEFTYMRQYAYNTLVEKTENRKNYIENEFQQKIPSVQETADKVNQIVAECLRAQNADISDLQKTKELEQSIMDASVDTMVDLLRRSMANDVFLILDTGDLYTEEGTNPNTKAALYLRDLDPITDGGYEDLMMEMGRSSIANSYGIPLDSGWSLHFEPDPDDIKNFGYYFQTMQTAQENNTTRREYLGYWSGFSNLSRSTAASMKYSVPLIAEDGTVYGILGIGLTENTILSRLPVHDFMSETACYVLAHETNKNADFDIVTHSGAAFSRLVGNSDSLPLGRALDDNIFDFDLQSSVSLAGSVQYISLYNSDSPYAEERWALISVADRDTILQPLTTLIHMLIVSAAVSLIVSIVIMLLSSREVVRPISDAIKTMNSSQEYSHVIRFQPSNIYELDMLTDAITQLQINVQDYSSQVSQMIRIADMGLGTFMYDRSGDTIFVGQSLLMMLHFPVQQEEDIEDTLMTRQEFLENISIKETRLAIMESLEMLPEESKTDYIHEYSIPQEDGSTIWMRLSLVHTKNNKTIGILQDVTNVVMEKKRIEYERDYDSTTGLLNRHAYYRRIEALFRDPANLKITAFLMIDLDNLKYVNDTYGHDFGDDYIKTAATALKKFQNYGAVVSRLSGDEFNVCLSGFDSKEEIRQIIDEVRTRLLQSYCLLADGTHFKIRASAGISWYPDDAVSSELLMKYADFAMYTIKHSTKGEVAEFDMTAYAKDSVLITGVEEMNRIIDECDVKYAFHSIVSAKTGQIYGYEALMRPQSTILQSPLELLRIAKTGAKLYEIERMTWTKALDDFQSQINAGRISKNCHLFVNSISNCVLTASDADAIEEAHPELLPQIVLEILESENVNEEYNARKLRRMKKWNAQIALDDFGTGYNSEYALITIQPNIIKIDRSIISGCDKDISRRMIITNLIRLVRSKNILVLAEGVETEEELKTVISCGVDLLQGYYINRPVFEPQPIPSKITNTIQRFASINIKNET